MKLTLWVIKIFFNLFVKCDSCNSTGKKIGLGMVENECKDCNQRRKIFDCFKRNKMYVLINFWIYFSIFLFLIGCIFIISRSREFGLGLSVSTMISLFGLVFLALKHRQDIFEYHLKLFNERLKIFLIVEDVILNFNAITKNKESEEEYKNRIKNLILKIKSIERRSFFIFSEETHKLILKIKENLIQVHHYQSSKEWTNEKGQAQIFMASLVDFNNLSEEFFELKINGF